MKSTPKDNMRLRLT